jgi:TPR repeat protein
MAPFRLLKLLPATLLLVAVVASAQRLQIVPDDDLDLANGFAAYQARDAKRALEHFRKAAERNQRVAQFNLAVMLLTGDGVPADPAAGLGWLRRAADNGMARAQHALGLLYDSGEHVGGRSPQQATLWYRKAAEQGWRDAQLNLGTQYFLGRGAPQDMREAARWYEKAAEQGDEGAAYILASLYEKGDGVERSYQQAFYWYSQAAASGDPAAAIKAKEMLGRLRAPG